MCDMPHSAIPFPGPEASGTHTFHVVINPDTDNSENIQRAILAASPQILAAAVKIAKDAFHRLPPSQ